MKRKRFIKNCVIVGAVMLLYLCVPQMLAALIIPGLWPTPAAV